MKKQLEIDYAFGYVYDKSKLIVMYPAGTNVIDLDDYEMEVEVAFLEDGIDAAFEENDVKEANETIKPLETFLMKPSKVIPFVTSIKNAETKEELHKLLAEFDEEYEVKENYIKVEIPKNIDPIKVSKAPIWEEYNARCISCGRCNFVCPTCTCFTMQDIFYKENKNVGERRRVWASCQVDGFTDIAGGHSFRNSKGDRLRFKAMHKVYDFNKRFGYQMCVGCGRCDDNCPQYISFSTTIDKINDFLKEDE